MHFACVAPFRTTLTEQRMAILKTGQRGFTLVELAITVAVLAVIVSIGVPSFRALVQNNRLVSQTNDFLADLALSRAEAMARGKSVSMCASTASCSDSDADKVCSGSASDWSKTRLVFLDSRTSGTVGERDDADSEPVLRCSSSGDDLSIEVKSVGATPVAQTSLSYLSSGALGAARTVSISLAGDTSSLRNLCISAAGTVRLKKGGTC